MRASGWQWGPEWCCHRCHRFDLRYEETAAAGVIYSHERVWHPVHPALAEQGPYVIVLVELPQADGVRIVGNLLGDPRAQVDIGAPVDRRIRAPRRRRPAVHAAAVDTHNLKHRIDEESPWS